MTTLPRWARITAVLVAAAVLPPLLGRLDPGTFDGLQARVLGLGICMAAAALALNLVMGYAGQISLGHFALVGVGAFTVGLLTSPERLGLPFAVALPAAAVLGAAIAFVVGLPALRLRGLYLAVVTIAFSYAMEQSVFRAQAITGGSSGVEVPRPIVGAFTFLRNADYLAILLVLLVLLWVVDVNVTRSRLGRAFQAIRADESVAASFGIDVARHKLLAFTISGAFAGVAGAMYGPLIGTVNASSFRYELSLLLVVIVVVGGLGSRVGVVAVAIVYTQLPRFFVFVFGEGVRGIDLVIGAVFLMVAVRNHPGGLPEIAHELRERRTARRDRKAGVDAAVEAEADPVLPRLPDMPRPAATAARPVLADGEPILEVRDLTVCFGGLTAVDEASLTVRRGEIAGLIGPNGAGKTTLFNAVSGLVRPQGGTIALLGRDVTNEPSHARAASGMGRTFQAIGLAKDRSVLENLLLAQHSVAGYGVAESLLSVGRAPRVERELLDRARAALAALGFEDRADVPVQLLSHGQQRIVELGCVLVTAPELVLLDEPSAGMAPGAAENLAVRLRDIRDQLGRTVLLIEHNIPLVLDVCDSLTVLSAGQVIASGSVDEVASRPEVVSAYLGESVPVVPTARAERARA